MAYVENGLVLIFSCGIILWFGGGSGLYSEDWVLIPNIASKSAKLSSFGNIVENSFSFVLIDFYLSCLTYLS